MIRPLNRTTYGAAIAALMMYLGQPLHASESDARRIQVFAAASMKEALDAVVIHWNRHQDNRVVVSYAGSNVLARQIEHGAPADLFVSANRKWMDYLADNELVRPATRQTLLENRLVLIAPANTAYSIALKAKPDFSRFLKDGRIAISHPAVPAGTYAEQALRHLGLWPSLRHRTAPSDNVRGSLLRVARGETPLGIVYRTDAMAEPRVRILDYFPADSHARITYPVALVSASDHPDSGKFLKFLISREAQAEFDRRGFLTPHPARN